MSDHTARRGRILIVDDDAPFAAVLARSLARDAEVAIDSSARAALARLARGERFDLVLSDVQMPGMDGPSLLRAIARSVPDAARAVALMTGGASPDEPGVTCLRKPVDLATLRRLILERESQCW